MCRNANLEGEAIRRQHITEEGASFMKEKCTIYMGGGFGVLLAKKSYGLF